MKLLAIVLSVILAIVVWTTLFRFFTYVGIITFGILTIVLPIAVTAYLIYVVLTIRR